MGTILTIYCTFIRYKATGSLHDHRARKHTNVKPYKCKLCDESFDVAKYRTAHMETAHGAVNDDVVTEVSSKNMFITK